ncbi:hypothetical protein [Leptospira interrogans]|uniref:Uncharacterized protein n=2 Tax=Leptospira interrogans TaxID=173 RepID=A0A0F6IJ10_LEPIR|nr:hypothetical protein [Leptospira interrogans]EMN37356.1 hypothetical protein LEP1GSC084_3220 [Leptospira interrogans serovar Medanensis str. L0448]EMN95808.1 hypothetical protein LEP1GSC110_3622 [Leptospira interrogans serovar Medanensis str. UT053]EMO94807.1 hypothetical protein LEP1GSC109_0128 [Leptospira interrogans str. UI 13372]EKR34117.1 hypothetical protein LEP1GSC096_2954 [Leptospira interrogans serovar Hebdomadis str. R499]EKR81469.1 hypothetical protein LEP1GSC099_0703 [Leptospira
MGPDPYTRIQNEAPNRFFEFPWKKSNQILINEISRFSRLAQLDAIGCTWKEFVNNSIG